MFSDLKNLKKKRAEKKRQEQALLELSEGQISAWEKEREELQKEIEQDRGALKALEENLWKLNRDIQGREKQNIELQGELSQRERELSEMKKEMEEKSGTHALEQFEDNKEESLLSAFKAVPDGYSTAEYALERPAQCERLRETLKTWKESQESAERAALRGWKSSGSST